MPMLMWGVPGRYPECLSGGPAPGRGTAKRLQASDVFTDMGCRLAAVDGVGTGAMIAHRPVGLALQGDLVVEPTAEYFPEKGATDRGRLRAAVGQPIGVAA